MAFFSAACRPCHPVALQDCIGPHDVGDWKSVSIFIETYVHTLDAGRNVADKFNAMRFDARL